MADSLTVAVAVTTWTKVATSIQKGTVYIKLNETRYFQTLIATGQPAPSDLSAVSLLKDRHRYDEAAAVDVYLYCPDAAGSVVVDV